MSLVLPSDPRVGQVITGSDGTPAAAFTKDGWAFFVDKKELTYQQPKRVYGEEQKPPKSKQPVKHFGPMGWLERQVEEICVLGRSAM